MRILEDCFKIIVCIIVAAFSVHILATVDWPGFPGLLRGLFVFGILGIIPVSFILLDNLFRYIRERRKNGTLPEDRPE